MTIPSLQTLHSLARVSVLVLFVIAMFTAQASSSLPEQTANCAALSAQTDPSTAATPRERSSRTLVTVSAHLLLFSVDTFLKLHAQEVADDRKTQVPD